MLGVVVVVLLVASCVLRTNAAACAPSQYTKSYTQSASGGAININFNSIATGTGGWEVVDDLWGLNGGVTGTFSNTIYECPNGAVGIIYDRGTTSSTSPIYPSIGYNLPSPILLSNLNSMVMNMNISYTSNGCDSSGSYDFAFDVWTSHVNTDSIDHPLDEYLIMYNWCTLYQTPSDPVVSEGYTYKYVNTWSYTGTPSWREDIFAIQPSQSAVVPSIDLVPFFKYIQAKYATGDFYVYSVQIGTEIYDNESGHVEFYAVDLVINGQSAAKFGTFSPTSPTAAPTTAPPTTTPAPTCSPASASGSVVTTTTSSICDSTGKKWTLTSKNQIAVNGVTDSSTANVVEIAYVNNVIWQENNQNLWWSWTNSAWNPPAGTSNSPLSTPTPAPTPKPTSAPTPPPTTKPTSAPTSAPCTTSASGSVVTTTSSYLCVAGKKWTITSGGQVAVNGVPDSSTANVVEIAYVNGVVWQENNQNLWWSYSSGAWLPAAGTSVSPISTVASITPTSSPSSTFAGGAVSVSFSVQLANTAYTSAFVGFSFAPSSNPTAKICETFTSPNPNLAAQQTYTYTLSCTISSTAAVGVYNLNIGAWDSNWNSIAYSSGVYTLSVLSPTAYITPDGISATTVARGRTFTVTVGVTAGSTSITGGFAGYSLEDVSTSNVLTYSNSAAVNLAAGATAAYTFSVPVSSTAATGAYKITMGLWDSNWNNLAWLSEAYDLTIS